MLSCKELTEVCSAEMERPLTLGERLSLRVHLMMCSGCTNYRQQLKTLSNVMQAYAHGNAVSDESALHDPDLGFTCSGPKSEITLHHRGR